jgi:hypothetical protein
MRSPEACRKSEHRLCASLCMPRNTTDNRPLGLGIGGRSMAASYGVIGGMLMFGVLGYALDQWLGSAPWLFMLGVVIGGSIALSGLRRLLNDRRR